MLSRLIILKSYQTCMPYLENIQLTGLTGSDILHKDVHSTWALILQKISIVFDRNLYCYSIIQNI